ncbi:MAG TPA: FkbM family methyltransferase [Clostridiales bacterium]|nr:FkbM family methyltransferase [Clostridiales bacterium]
MVDKLGRIQEIVEKLGDEESKCIFNARIQYAIKRDETEFLNDIFSLYKEYRINEFESFISNLKNGDKKNIVIFGAGYDGKKTWEILKRSKYRDRVIAFADNNIGLIGKQVDSLNVLSPDDLLNKEYIVLIATAKYVNQIYEQLLRYDIPRESIFYPRMRKIYAENGWQYFDTIKPKENEVFIDAGCYNGSTSIQFSKWCHENYEMIYAFEPDKLCKQRCIENFKKNNLKKVQFIEKGTYSEDGIISFLGGGMSYSKLIADKQIGNCVAVTSIDNVLKGKKATFIKLDVEGSELETLKGAKETIIKYKPRLAISVYHKPEDIIELPFYILGLVNDYKLYLRHYTASVNETILYAE